MLILYAPSHYIWVYRRCRPSEGVWIPYLRGRRPFLRIVTRNLPHRRPSEGIQIPFLRHRRRKLPHRRPKLRLPIRYLPLSRPFLGIHRPSEGQFSVWLNFLWGLFNKLCQKG